MIYSSLGESSRLTCVSESKLHQSKSKTYLVGIIITNLMLPIAIVITNLNVLWRLLKNMDLMKMPQTKAARVSILPDVAFLMKASKYFLKRMRKNFS